MDFIHRDCLLSDYDLFFGPLTGDDYVTVIDDKTTWPDILVASGVFKSKTEARKNCREQNVTPGFHDNYWGKKKIRVTVLNNFDG